MAGSFFERMDHLKMEVGHGEIEAKCEVDQVYAHYQEVNDQFNHPRGGEAHALRNSLYETYNESLEDMAKKVLHFGLRDAVSLAAERISDKYQERAPLELEHLQLSGHPTAIDNGDVYYDRPPIQRRLSDAEIRALDAFRNMIDPNHLYGSYYNRRRKSY